MNSKNIAMGLVVIAVIALAVWTLGSKPTTPLQQGAAQPTNTQLAQEDANPASYKDGTYEEIGNYTSPNGKEEVDVTITLKDGIVASAEFTGKATHEISKKMQGQFKEGFKEEVVGKSINDVALTVVNGSSLTPKGFMDALNKIKQEAKQS